MGEGKNTYKHCITWFLKKNQVDPQVKVDGRSLYLFRMNQQQACEGQVGDTKVGLFDNET